MKFDQLTVVAFWTVWLLSGSFVLPAEAGTIEAVGSEVDAVTVFRDRAEVVRSARIALPAGSSTVEFRNIPPGVDSDSVRVRANGVAATLGAVQIVNAAEEAVDTPEFVTLREQIEALERKLEESTAQQQVDNDLLAFLRSLQAARATTVADDLARGGAVADDLGAFYDLLVERRRAIAMRGVERRAAERKLREELQLAQARKATLRPAGQIRSRIARVELQADHGGSLELELAYVVPGASWRPAYRASLNADTGAVDLTVEGVVRQNTGEDWSGVALKLSTAAPMQGVEPPFLTPTVLRPVSLQVAREADFFEPAEESKRSYQNTLELAPGLDGTEGHGLARTRPTAPAEVAEASLESSAYNVSFVVAGRSDIPADGRDYRVVLNTDTIEGNLVHRIVPELDPRAFLTSVTTTPADYPILAGRARVFADGAHLGSYLQDELGPGVEWTVPFGVDNRVEVVRILQPDNQDRSGFRDNKRTVDFVHRTQVKNLQSRSVKIVLEERLPVSEDTRIEVQLDEKMTSSGSRKSERRSGVMIWTFDLRPGEKREFKLAYSVTHPANLQIEGASARR